MPRCKQCKTKTDDTKVIYTGVYRFCSNECRKQFGIEHAKKLAEKAKVERVKKVQKERAEKKRKVNTNNTRKQLDLTKTVFNKLRRLEEFVWFKEQGKEPECISCGKKNMDWCCGHYKTVGSSGELRFDRMNTYLQCNRYCNKALSGNIEGNKTTRGYKQGLIDRFGQEKAQEIFDYCEVSRVKKWTGPELVEMRKGFNAEIRRLQTVLDALQ